MSVRAPAAYQGQPQSQPHATEVAQMTSQFAGMQIRKGPPPATPQRPPLTQNKPNQLPANPTAKQLKDFTVKAAQDKEAAERAMAAAQKKIDNADKALAAADAQFITSLNNMQTKLNMLRPKTANSKENLQKLEALLSQIASLKTNLPKDADSRKVSLNQIATEATKLFKSLN